MTSIYLIRHGQASFGQDNYDCLSPLGERQAHRLGEHFAHRLPPSTTYFDKIIRGDMRRHQQTAEACIQSMGTELKESTISIDSRWNEYDHQDILTKFDSRFSSASELQTFVITQENPQKALNKIFAGAFARWLSDEYPEDYIESWSAFQQRVLLAFEDTLAHIDDHKSIGLFSSGGAISIILLHLMNIPREHFMSINKRLVNCGVSKLICGKTGTFVSSMNEHSAFESDAKNWLSYL